MSGRSDKGVARSLAIYYGDPLRDAAMDALHARFVTSGNLVFDIGAHVGDRIASFRRLGARVVAVEANPALLPILEKLYGQDRQVALIGKAIGSEHGEVALRINSANPTVSTASTDFIRAADGALGWEGQVWDETRIVPVTTFDALIAEHGEPAFAKIDIEGYEAEALAGLSRPLPTLSFEFTTIQREIALACIDRMTALGHYGFTLAIGESQQLDFAEPIDGEAMKQHIRALPMAANSGDIYAIRMKD
jgi:FkbM family methyltransferase